ncbi:hypothetical protein CK203_004568 [Vitis vinifera]|uniref:Uncharacterized protein n=1 Tax=Vitis vinifera TaxID=29760 RepID=A0A438KFN4_VITVI|nr:hypothetical protein CK203_004568 [Vitis vinifera]
MLSHALSPSHSSLYHGYQSPAPSDSWLPSLQLEVPEIPSKSPSIFPSATQSSSSFSQEHLKLKKKSLSCSCCERKVIQSPNSDPALDSKTSPPASSSSFSSLAALAVSICSLLIDMFGGLLKLVSTLGIPTRLGTWIDALKDKGGACECNFFSGRLVFDLVP